MSVLCEPSSLNEKDDFSCLGGTGDRRLIFEKCAFRAEFQVIQSFEPRVGTRNQLCERDGIFVANVLRWKGFSMLQPCWRNSAGTSYGLLKCGMPHAMFLP